MTDHSGTRENPPVASTPKVHLPIARWTFALCLLTIGSMSFGEIQAGWFGSYIKTIVGTLYIDVGFVIALSAVIGTVFYLIWGAISDNLRTRLGRRVPLILVGTVATSGLMLLFASSSNYIFLLICWGVFIAISSSMFRSTKSLTPDLIPQEKRGRVNTVLVIMSTIGSATVWIPALIFLPGGGQSYPRETHGAFISYGAILLALVGVAITILVREPPISEPPRSWVLDLRKILNRREMAQHSSFLRIFVANLFVMAADSAYFSFLLLFIESIDFEIDQVIIAGPIVGAFLGINIYLMGKSTDRVGRKKVTLTGFSIAPVGACIIALSGGNLWILMIGFGVFFSFYLGANTAVESWRQDIIPQEARGRFYGILNIGSAISQAIGAILAGFLADTFHNVSWVFLATAILLWASVPFYFRVQETVKNNEKPDSEKEKVLERGA